MKNQTLQSVRTSKSGLPTCLHQKKARSCPKKADKIAVLRHIRI